MMGEARRRSMRSTMLSLVVLGAVAGGLGEARAQSAYDYPWCAVYANRSGATACYYATYAQCMATIRGIGGYCISNPYSPGGGAADGRPRREPTANPTPARGCHPSSTPTWPAYTHASGWKC